MATEIKTWEIIDGKLRPLDSRLADHGRLEAFDLEAWLASDPTIVRPGLKVIGRQVMTRSGAYNCRGRAYRDNGDLNRALLDFNKAIELQSEFTEAFYYRGLTYGKLGAYEKAISDLKQVLQFDPGKGIAYYFIGLAYDAMGQTKQAVSSFSEIPQLVSKQFPPFSIKGCCKISS